MAKGQYDTRAKIKTDGEVGDLVNSFNINGRQAGEEY